ncbi:PREDICTED: uncharacterized protein LOC104821647 isoform X2 [Tarenaya hassleriana]|uniref:uncharacterized protein LOC104821647 isoform X2 n=1 Tax=Tarenaya hassleriana TaxID=28532 RepID=UPI00053C2B74|nr:PREDICTED: uncharacterized protein LOC104821647 isoform X2 [Tarenaya hassleriana]
MDLASRIRRSFLRDSRKTQNNTSPRNEYKPQRSSRKEDDDNGLLGVTDELLDHVRTFAIDTFKNFPLEEEEASVNPDEDGSHGTNSSDNMRKDLSDWQERHAVLVLSKSKELSQLRFKLCPRLLKERQFWRIYFKLVRNLVAGYELQAIQWAKIRRMAMEDEEAPKNNCVHEVEMAETKQGGTSSRPQTP